MFDFGYVIDTNSNAGAIYNLKKDKVVVNPKVFAAELHSLIDKGLVSEDIEEKKAFQALMYVTHIQGTVFRERLFEQVTKEQEFHNLLKKGNITEIKNFYLDIAKSMKKSMYELWEKAEETIPENLKTAFLQIKHAYIHLTNETYSEERVKKHFTKLDAL